MSWESTVTYYQLLNRGIAEKLGGLHSAKILLHSFDFGEVARLQKAQAWDAAAELLSEAGTALERAGADMLLICTNTMHLVAPQVEQSLKIPLLHIADAAGAALRQAGVSKVGLLGTRFTMEHPFYKDRLAAHFGLDVVVPDETARKEVHDIIYTELCKGIVAEPSRRRFCQVIDELASVGAEAILLGCTEIGLLVEQPHTRLQLFDTTYLHASAAIELALQ